VQIRNLFFGLLDLIVDLGRAGHLQRQILQVQVKPIGQEVLLLLQLLAVGAAPALKTLLDIQLLTVVAELSEIIFCDADQVLVGFQLHFQMVAALGPFD